MSVEYILRFFKMKIIGGIMKSIEAVIFDMDGMLFDTERISLGYWKKLSKKYGYDMNDETYISLIGRSYNAFNEMLLRKYGINFPIDKIRDEKNIEMLKFLEDNGAPIKPGAYELLNFLFENGYKIALATSTPRGRAVDLLERAGIKDKFKAIVCGDDVVNSKPNPEIFLKAAEIMAVNPENCIVLEDSPAGIEAAYNGGMVPINVPDLKQPDEEVKKFAHKIFENLVEVKNYIEALDVKRIS